MAPTKGSGSFHCRKVWENLGRTTTSFGGLGAASDRRGRAVGKIEVCDPQARHHILPFVHNIDELVETVIILGSVPADGIFSFLTNIPSEM